MGYMLIAASQSRDSPVDEALARQQEAPNIPKGHAEPSHAYSLEPSGEQRGLRGCTSLSGEPCAGVTSVTDAVIVRHFSTLLWMILEYYMCPSLLLRLRHDVCMLNWLLLGDGDI